MGWFESTARSEAQIEAEIRDELEFHLEQRTRELVEQGMGADEARAEAERRFGSVERVRQSCRRVQLGERIMLQRIQFVLNLVLIVAVGVLGWRYWQSNASVQDQLHKLSQLLEPRAALLAASAGPQPPHSPRPALERFKALKDPAAAAAWAEQMLAWESDAGPGAMNQGWHSVESPQVRIALLAPFVTRGGHGRAIEILHLAATDRDAEVREQAFRFLKSYAFQDFSGKPLSIYHEWHDEIGQKPLGDALTESAKRYAERLRAASGAPLVRELVLIESIDLEPAQVRGRDVLHDILWSGGEENLYNRAYRWIESDNTEIQFAGLRFVAHFPQLAEAISSSVLNVVLAWPWKSPALVVVACRALAACPQLPMETNSEVSLHLLRFCVENDTPEVRQAVGSGILERLWRLPSGSERGAAQWIAWWKENRAQFSDPKLLESEDARWLDAR